ncbi:MAG TPA: two-component regulator propeller domain-containing protein [Thermoanaerobaculaceae bacterium]|nr:two-component regulator propeller domain-containing protein [Thermoanaerobaculaceae bacterium]HRS17222.1 two-component regulator propeller domain-containing protein [Thermoanaerobaculaceae bacterium]
MRRLGEVGIVLLAASVAAAGGYEELPLVHFTTEHELTPLPSASVQKVAQDSQGFLWLGFYSTGLARYDGRRLETFGAADGLPSVTVREIVEDSDSRLWVGTESGLAVSSRPLRSLAPGERLRFITAIGGRPLQRLRVHRHMMVADRHGGVWVATRGRRLTSYRIEETDRLVERVVHFAPDPPDPTDDAAAIVQRRDGSLWVGTTTGRLLMLPAGGEEPREVARVADGINALHEGPTGTLWAGSMSGAVWRFDDGTREMRPVGRLGEWVVALLETPGGELWVGTLGEGLLLVAAEAPDHQRHLTRRHGLLSNTVWSLALDREGNLWLAQNGGLSRLRPNYRAFGVITGRACAPAIGTLPEPGAFCSLPDPPSEDRIQLWVGTGVGLLAFSAAGSCEALDSRSGLVSSSVYALECDREGRIWVATPRGLSVISFGAALPPALAGSPTAPLRLHGRRGQVRSYPWGVTYGCTAVEWPARSGGSTAHGVWVVGAFGVACHVEGRWLFFRERAGMPASAATGLAMDADFRVWISTLDAGVFRSTRPLPAANLLQLTSTPLSGGGREVVEPVLEAVWSTATGAPTNTANTLRAVGRRVWVGTDTGLFALEEGSPARATRLDRASGLGGDNVRGLAVSPLTGNLWVSQNGGAAEVDPLTGRVLRTVSKADGLADNEAWAYETASTGRDGTVYLATPSGLAVYRPWLDVRRPQPPAVAIRRATFHQDWSGNNELVVEYAALAFANEQAVRFRTRLAGYEERWSDPTPESRIRYTNLPAFLFGRTYVLEVSAASGEGVWATEPARFAVRVRPAWWASWVAVMAYLLALGFGVVVYTNLHSRSLRLRAAELEREVASRTAEIRAQAAELETLDSIVEAVNRQTTLRTVLQALLDHGLRLVPQAEKALYTAREPDSGRFRVAAVSGWAPGVFDGLALTEQEALTRYSEHAERLREGVFIVRDFEDLPGSEQVRDVPVPRAMLSMAVVIDGTLAGFLVFDNFSDSGAFARADLRRLERFRQHAISAISKARLLEELRQRTLEAQQANAAKSAFLASMSHELRTPLNSIIGFSEILAERIGPGLEPRYHRFLRNISSAGTHLLGLINDILDLSKIEAGRMQLAPEPLAPRAVAEGVVAAMKAVAAERHIAIELRCAEDLPLVEADPVRIKQVLFNLLSNAVKFSPDGAVVRLEIEPLALERSPVGAAAVALRVVDRGIGIDPSKLHSIFEEFVQADDSTARRYGGTGLGLALVKRFVEMHRGVVQVESTPGLGSTFTVVFPCRFAGGA